MSENNNQFSELSNQYEIVEETHEELVYDDNIAYRDAFDTTISKKPSFAQAFLDYVEIFVFAIAFVILLFSFVVRLCTVKGPSMENTLHQGELLAVSDFVYEPERGDIIVFHQTQTLNEPVVKRVIATAGETIDIDFNTWTVIITDIEGNTFVLDEPYMHLDREAFPVTSNHSYPYVVPEGCLYVMGDNRNHSADSRGSLIGPVDERRVLGKVIFRITPFNKFGAVE